MQVIGKKITAVGNDGSKSDLDLRIIDRLSDLARHVPQCRPEHRSSEDCPEEQRDSLSRAQATRNDASKQDLENNHRRPVIQETLTLNDDREPLLHSEVLEDGKYGNRICGRNDRPKQQRD